MSIAALKRKTMNGNPRMAPISGSNNGPLGFALNGTRRISGVVGNTNLASRGSSKSIYMPCCANDSNTIKPSVKNTKGMLSVRYNNCSNNCQTPIVQEIIKTQNEYIKKLHASCHNVDKQLLQTTCGATYSDETVFKCNNNCQNKFIGGRNVFKGSYTKPTPGAISQSDYIASRYLNKNAFLLPNSNCEQHFPPNVNNNGCNTYYNSLADMKAAGLI